MPYISTLLRESSENISYKKAVFLGLGFFIITATWSLYNSFVPIFLKRFIAGETLIGLIMTFDNIAAITLQPYFGALSDNTDSRFGHRMPFLLIGVPIAALFFALIPLANNIWLLLFFIIIMNFSMSVFRSPTIALMPDLTPPRFRSKANGVINLMGGAGAVLTYLLGSYLYDINPLIPFVLFAIIMIVILILFLLKIKEPPVPKSKHRIRITAVIKNVFTATDKKVLYVLMAIFFWFFGFSGVETFFTLYGREFLMIKESAAAMSLTFFSLSFVIFSLPSGFLSARIGRKKTIISGITGLIIVFSTVLFLRNLLFLRIALGVGGIFWALININSYPMVVDEAGEKIGAYTGLYYFFTTIPAILSPIFVGFIIENLGYIMLFVNAVGAFILALYFMLKVEDERTEGLEK
ncbi:MAG: MFS transporter [Bacillota bacterium]